MNRTRRTGRLVTRCIAATFGFFYALTLFAQNPLLDEVTTRIEESTAKVRIRFTAPVRYLRHFPIDHGDLVQIFFRVTAVDGTDISQREEVRRVRATSVLPGFSVTYRRPLSSDASREPLSVLVQFDRPVRFDVTEGRDKRSFYLVIPIAPSNR